VATINRDLTPESARFLSTAFPQYKSVPGTNFAVSVLFYDAAAIESAYWKFPSTGYGSGNVTVDLFWYADTASSGDVVWGCALAAITPNTDTQDVETKAFATQNTATDTHLGTTGQRLHQIAVTVTNLDSLAVGDMVWIRIQRVATDAGDTMTGDAGLVLARVSYSDT
jgi:hypothetical protein